MVYLVTLKKNTEQANERNGMYYNDNREHVKCVIKKRRKEKNGSRV
jgi:hypothetical protein